MEIRIIIADEVAEVIAAKHNVHELVKEAVCKMVEQYCPAYSLPAVQRLYAEAESKQREAYNLAKSLITQVITR